MTRRGLISLLLATLLLAVSPARAGQARIAVASNFGEVARLLADDYSRRSGHAIQVSTASTGKLYAQIGHGAPFDILLSADDTTPLKLVREGLAIEASLYDYATGRLVLWSRRPELVRDGEALLRAGTFNKLAIANPELAPYGAAARELLTRLGRWDALQPKLVLGENVGQAMQFAFTANADVGLLPRSLAMEAEKKVGGSSWLVPQEQYRPIVQSAVLLSRARDNAAAVGFLQYLRGDAARAVIRAHGYD
ncbi:molybdate ABC transporter substrate-binding protein [Lysobacter concretionis Ko07 = DSM 16239]|uniref:Molybdate ABC transporter substrate-binding protein n=1 Tax=Lysobacter concretionis Ko07 = DSM 16239 TaxID=1122185 RepID=A0A0A0EPD9_9GAMM|nr:MULTISPECIES: molybdate ABC transporter substrate-binding protein [Lysobacter]KGM52284.1 molybdate ABC transporter substrate-binding protein [Lysobacter concretionis Ko07 = DSM 16239]QOD91982.1 molybdate ABC transporter substrate-binding protein [Lysobacter sp. CW239]